MKRIVFAVLLAVAGLSVTPGVASAAPCPEGVPDAGGGCSIWVDSSTGANRAFVCHTNLFMTCGGSEFWTQARDGSWFRG